MARDWTRLTADERSELMALAMSPRYTRYGGMLPDDCSECGSCGTPILGSGWCASCYTRYDQLIEKAARKVPA